MHSILNCYQILNSTHKGRLSKEIRTLLAENLRAAQVGVQNEILSSFSGSFLQMDPQGSRKRSMAALCWMCSRATITFVMLFQEFTLILHHFSLHIFSRFSVLYK